MLRLNVHRSVTLSIVSGSPSTTSSLAKDEVVDGDPDTIERVTDLWTFNRNIKSKNPNWTLVKTETPSDGD